LDSKNFQQGTGGGGSHCILRHLSQHDHQTLHSNWWGSGPTAVKHHPQSLYIQNASLLKY
jgi:hypothetical protein